MQKKHMTKSNTQYNTLSKLGIERNFLKLVKTICKKPLAYIILHGEKLEVFHLRSCTRKGYLLPPLLFNIILKTVANAIR